MINKRRLVSSFKKLVRIDSPSLQEGKIIEYLQRELKALGLRSCQMGRPRGGEAGNLVAHLPGKGCRYPQILINAHVDTVTPGVKIKPIEKGEYIFTDGSTILGADNKAGVATILEILTVLKEKRLPHPPLKIIFTVAEEIGLVGAKMLPEKAMTADFGLTLDGGEIEELIHKAPSQYSLEATIIGKAAHAGIHPEEGINAIKVASEAIAGMKLGRIDKETTANIGLIEGGRATNIIPDRVKVKGEARSHDIHKLEHQVEQMERVLLKACQKHRARLNIKVERVYKAFEISYHNRILKQLVIAMKSSGIKPLIKETGGGSDANIFNEWGIPTLILGVGADRVHTTKEQIRAEDLIRGAEMVLQVIRSFCEWKNSKKKR
jgi:tripeptide aminopeptidase